MELINDRSEELEFDKSKIHVIVIPWLENPHESFRRSCEIVYILRTQHNVFCYSPIMHTHHFNEYWKNIGVKPPNQQDYYDWCLRIYESLKDTAIFCFTEDWALSSGCCAELSWCKDHNADFAFLVGEPGMQALSPAQLAERVSVAFQTVVKENPVEIVISPESETSLTVRDRSKISIADLKTKITVRVVGISSSVSTRGRRVYSHLQRLPIKENLSKTGQFVKANTVGKVKAGHQKVVAKLTKAAYNFYSNRSET